MAELTESEFQSACNRLVSNEVQSCISSLVAEIAKGVGCDAVADLAELALELCIPVYEEEEGEEVAREVYEHWIVSPWLAEELAKRGERIEMDFFGLAVWGRTTTGQGIAMDSVIREIVSELHSA